MRADFLIVGQGLAGTLLAWEFERAEIPFAIADAGHGASSSCVAAGIINPITGRRLVKSWRIEERLPVARATYRELEAALGVPLWREMRVRRIFSDDRERRVLAEKRARGEWGAFAGRETDEGDGFWIEHAARVDLPALLGAARERWRTQGRLRAEAVDVTTEAGRHELVIDCTGVAGARSVGSAQTRGGAFAFVPWEFSKGETLVLAVDGLAPDVILNRGRWVLPVSPGAAWVGATAEPGVTEDSPTPAAREALTASARAMLGARTFAVTGQMVGVRVTLPDRHPVAGRHPENPRLGVINGLGSKGALHAPTLARQWVKHLTAGVPFDAEIAVDRFVICNSAQASSRRDAIHR